MELWSEDLRGLSELLGQLCGVPFGMSPLGQSPEHQEPNTGMKDLWQLT